MTSLNGTPLSGGVGFNRRRADLFASAMYLLACLAMLFFMRLRFGWISLIDDRYGIGVLFGIACVFMASISLFAVINYGDLFALVGALSAWPLFWLVEFHSYTFSAWLVFNLPYSHQGLGGKLSDRVTIFDVELSCLLAVGLLIYTTVIAVVRLAPRRWAFRDIPICDRLWPALAISVGLTGAWFVKSVTPYRIPAYDIHSNSFEVSILHVEKHGLRLHETRVALTRDGRAFVAEDTRRLFDYSFPKTVSDADLNEGDSRLLEDVRTSPPALRGPVFLVYPPPRSWNEEQWFVSLRYSPKMIELYPADVPPEIVTLFQDAQMTPPQSRRLESGRDVCFGFCYDPTYF